MTEQEELVKKVVGMWSGGVEPTIASWRDHAAPDLVWWNSARGAVEGLDACLEAIGGFYQALNVDHVEVPIKSIVSDGNDLVVIERSDNSYLADGSLLAAVPVVGVVIIRDGKITEWRDYCDDWVAKLGINTTAQFDSSAEADR